MELSPPDPRVGQVLQGRYRILERVAAGAMGVVYRGERVELGRPVAVKFLHPWIAAQQAFRARFETEARAMSRLSHPNCVSVMDFGVEGAPYLIMDYITGVTLRKVLESGRLAPARAVAITRQLLAGVAHAHGQSIIHRDLKPDNLILSDTDGLPDHVRILDFGLAKLRDGPAMTSGLAIGTPSYMSPEQTGAPGEIDGRTDIYAIGVVLHEMLAGQKPFAAEKIAEILLMHRDVPPTPLRKVVPAAGISAALEGVVLRALQKKAEDRFQTAAEFVEALERVPEATTAAAKASALDKAAVAAAAPVAAPPRAPTAAAVRDADKTTIDPPRAGSDDEGPSVVVSSSAEGPVSLSAVERAAVSGTPMRWIGLGALVLVALLLLLVGLRHRPGEERGAGRAPGPGAVAARAPGLGSASAPAPSAVAPVAPVAAPSGPGAAPAGKEAAAPPPPPPPPAPSVQEREAEAARLIGRGEWEQALVVLEKARRENPEDASAAYQLANLCLEHQRWAEGAQAARVAGQRDGRYRSDEKLVKNLIHALGSDKGYEKTEDVLHGFGAPATSLLKEAAAHDKNPQVRERAAEILRGRGKGPRASRSTFSRPPPSSSRGPSPGRSVFSR